MTQPEHDQLSEAINHALNMVDLATEQVTEAYRITVGASFTNATEENGLYEYLTFCADNYVLSAQEVLTELINELKDQSPQTITP